VVKFFVLFGKHKKKMSRIGKQIISIPEKVTVKLQGQKIDVTGPKGNLSRVLPSLISCELVKSDDNKKSILVTVDSIKASKRKLPQSLYGLSRTMVSNMVLGVSEGFSKKLQISGVGYRAQLDGKNLVLNMGYSNPVRMEPPSSLSINLESPTVIVVSGLEKDVVGEFAAKVRSVRSPEPYKGKGIAYEGEYIRRKAGKVGKK
jgi:large subunit ribosomal protein L6